MTSNEQQIIVKTEAEVQAIDIKTSLEVDRIITLETLK